MTPNVLHREIGLPPESAIRRAGSEDLGNAGVLQTGQSLRFLLKASQQCGVGPA